MHSPSFAQRRESVTSFLANGRTSPTSTTKTQIFEDSLHRTIFSQNSVQSGLTTTIGRRSANGRIHSFLRVDERSFSNALASGQSSPSPSRAIGNATNSTRARFSFAIWRGTLSHSPPITSQSWRRYSHMRAFELSKKIVGHSKHHVFSRHRPSPKWILNPARSYGCRKQFSAPALLTMWFLISPVATNYSSGLGKHPGRSLRRTGPLE